MQRIHAPAQRATQAATVDNVSESCSSTHECKCLCMWGWSHFAFIHNRFAGYSIYLERPNVFRERKWIFHKFALTLIDFTQISVFIFGPQQ